MSSAGFSLGCSKVMSMNVVRQSFGDVTTLGGDTCPPCTGLTPDALPEVQMPVMAEDLQSGVSARSIFLQTDISQVNARRFIRVGLQDDRTCLSLKTTKINYSWLIG